MPSHLRLHCGRKSISPTTFLSFLEIESADQSSYGYNLGGTIPFFLLGRRREREPHQKKKRKDGLHDWLSGCLAQPLSGSAEPFSCTEPRDLVYALLGISSDCQSGRLKPDYAKPLLEVYKDVFKLPARRRWQENRSSWAPSQTIPHNESKLRNDLALRLGLINTQQNFFNDRQIAEALATNSSCSSCHLVWPSGEVKFRCFGKGNLNFEEYELRYYVGCLLFAIGTVIVAISICYCFSRFF